MIYIVPTPIGNIKDITYRAVEVLNTVDKIYCEDTRRSIKLLSHYDIRKPLESYNKDNEYKKIDKIIHELNEGKDIALVSDAGTPLISDPGSILIKRLIEENIKLEVLPGACAFIAGLCYTGYNLEEFAFYGFLPKKNSKRVEKLKNIKEKQMIACLYVSPHEIKDVVKSVISVYGENIDITLAKELTKLYEKVINSKAAHMLDYLDSLEVIKGEYVLIIDKDVTKKDDEILDVVQEVNRLIDEEKMSKKDAIKNVAKRCGVHKNDIYIQMID